jgi:hypothetical protein
MPVESKSCLGARGGLAACHSRSHLRHPTLMIADLKPGRQSKAKPNSESRAAGASASRHCQCFCRQPESRATEEHCLASPPSPRLKSRIHADRRREIRITGKCVASPGEMAGQCQSSRAPGVQIGTGAMQVAVHIRACRVTVSAEPEVTIMKTALKQGPCDLKIIATVGLSNLANRPRHHRTMATPSAPSPQLTNMALSLSSSLLNWAPRALDPQDCLP